MADLPCPIWVLAINTATDAASVGVVPIPILDGTHRSAVEILLEPPAGRSGHSERLLGLIDTAVKMAGMTTRDLQGVAVVCGPGSFTGVRTGLAVGRTIAQVLSIPIWGVDTLEALAAGCGRQGLVAPLLDARRGEVFAALYRDGTAVESAPRLVALEAFLADLPAGEPICMVGEGAMRHQETLARHQAFTVGPAEIHTIRPATVARLAAPHLLRGGTDPLALLPRYQRAPTMAPDWIEGAVR